MCLDDLSILTLLIIFFDVMFLMWCFCCACLAVHCRRSGRSLRLGSCDCLFWITAQVYSTMRPCLCRGTDSARFCCLLLLLLSSVVFGWFVNFYFVDDLFFMWCLDRFVCDLCLDFFDVMFGAWCVWMIFELAFWYEFWSICVWFVFDYVFWSDVWRGLI